jgi:hypothetical protein
MFCSNVQAIKKIQPEHLPGAFIDGSEPEKLLSNQPAQAGPVSG